MGVVNTKSINIQNQEASPRVLSHRSLVRAPVYTEAATVAVAAADDDTSVYRFLTIPSNAVITSIKVYCDALTSGTDWDFGVYQTAENGGAVVDADLFGDGVDLSSAITLGTEIRFNDTVTANITEVNKRLWELLPGPLTADPQRSYDLCFTANTVGSGAGDITVVVQYTV